MKPGFIRLRCQPKRWLYLFFGLFLFTCKKGEDHTPKPKQENADVLTSCGDNSNRPQVAAHLTPLGKLSLARSVSMVEASGKILFAGGYVDNVGDSDFVDVYDTLAKTWSESSHRLGRRMVTAIGVGNKVFFAGGEQGDPSEAFNSSIIDIYDVATGDWTTAHLSEGRSHIAAAVVGNKVFFAGGVRGRNEACSDRVDIYDLSTNTWSTAKLSTARMNLSAVTVDNKIYFTGGFTSVWITNVPSPMIDIYDNSTGTWYTSALTKLSGGVTGVALDHKIYWAQGCDVEVRDVPTGTTTLAKLSQASPGFALTEENSVKFLKYYPDNNLFDIYETTSHTWKVGVLPQTFSYLNGLSVNNTVYVLVDGLKFWRLEF